MSLETVPHVVFVALGDAGDGVPDVAGDGLDGSVELLVSVVHPDADNVLVALLDLFEHVRGLWEHLLDGAEGSGGGEGPSLDVDLDSFWDFDELFCEDGFSHCSCSACAFCFSLWIYNGDDLSYLFQLMGWDFWDFLRFFGCFMLFFNFRF